MVFFRNPKTFVFRSPVLSCALGCGARRGPARTRRRKRGSRPGSMVRSLGVQSREIWQVTTGSPSAELELSNTMENPHISFFAPPSHSRTTLASSFPRSCSDGHCYGCVNHYYACVDITYAYVCCVYVTSGCLRGCAGLCICVLEPHISAF